MPDEVIVVDDGSASSSVKDVCALHRGMRIRYIRNQNPGETNCCHGRNVALRAAAGDEVIWTDPEMLFFTDVVKQMALARERYPHNVLHEECCLQQPYHGADPEFWRYVPGLYVHMARRDWMLEVGGWDEALPGPWGWDDIDLHHRLEHASYVRKSLPELVVLHRWHEPRSGPAAENEAYFRAKEFPRDIVANAGREWGVCKG
jgi:GT2 family glycosyltransferase